MRCRIQIRRKWVRILNTGFRRLPCRSKLVVHYFLKHAYLQLRQQFSLKPSDRQCPLCPSLFRNHRTLIEHMGRVHADKQEFVPREHWGLLEDDGSVPPSAALKDELDDPLKKERGEEGEAGPAGDVNSAGVINPVGVINPEGDGNPAEVVVNPVGFVSPAEDVNPVGVVDPLEVVDWAKFVNSAWAVNPAEDVYPVGECGAGSCGSPEEGEEVAFPPGLLDVDMGLFFDFPLTGVTEGRLSDDKVATLMLMSNIVWFKPGFRIHIIFMRIQIQSFENDCGSGSGGGSVPGIQGMIFSSEKAKIN